MTAQTAIPLYEERETFYVPSFEIKIRGTPVPKNVVRDVIEVKYEDAVDKIDSFTLTVNNWDADARTPKYIGLDTKPDPHSDAGRLAVLFEPGNELELWMGYQGNPKNLRLMMTGYITTVEPDFPEAAAPKLTVRGLNVLDRFRQRQYTWGWPDAGQDGIRDSDVAFDLGRDPGPEGGRPGLGIEVRVNDAAKDAEPLEPFIAMRNQYPIVFLVERARRRGYALFVAEDPASPGRPGGKPKRFLYFGPSQQLRDITYRLEWGKSLVSFRPTMTTGNQVTQVTVLGWDRVAKKPISGQAKLEDHGKALNLDLHPVARAANRQEVVSDLPVSTQAEADTLAKDILLKQLRNVVEASGATVGLPDLRAGRMVVLSNVGYRFKGQYFVTQTEHTINESGYRTTFKARREETGGAG